MPELIASLAHLAVRGEHAVHRALRAEVAAFVEQRRVDLRGRKVDEAGFVQDVEDVSGALLRRERQRRDLPRRTGPRGPAVGAPRR